MVATGKAKVDDFKFMLHLCGWAPGQLQAEIDRGVWLPVASSANVSQTYLCFYLDRRVYPKALPRLLSWLSSRVG